MLPSCSDGQVIAREEGAHHRADFGVDVVVGPAGVGRDPAAGRRLDEDRTTVVVDLEHLPAAPCEDDEGVLLEQWRETDIADVPPAVVPETAAIHSANISFSSDIRTRLA